MKEIVNYSESVHLNKSLSSNDLKDALGEASDEEILLELEKFDEKGLDLIQKKRMFQEPSEQELIRELNKTEASTAEEKYILHEIIKRFTEPVKYKIKFYQIAALMYIDRILTLFFIKLEELQPTKTNLKIIKFQSQIKLDIFSKENLERTRILVYKLNLKAEYAIGQLQSMHHHCLTHQDTPDLFCEPYIHKGFRPVNMPYSYYVKSLFTKHNETINAWSHYLGAMYTAYCAWHYDFSDLYSWPIFVSHHIHDHVHFERHGSFNASEGKMKQK